MDINPEDITHLSQIIEEAIPFEGNDCQVKRAKKRFRRERLLARIKEFFKSYKL